jgi:hypothetical protein
VAPSPAAPTADSTELKRQLTEALNLLSVAKISKKLWEDKFHQSEEKLTMLEAQTPSDLVIQVVLAACVLFSYYYC